MLRHPHTKASDVWGLGCIFAEVEQATFFHKLPCEGNMFSCRAGEYHFMLSLATRLCPMAAARKELLGATFGSMHAGLSKEVLQLGAVAPTVVGVRFRSPEFHKFMANMLHFQPKARATAQDLLKHPWPQP